MSDFYNTSYDFQEAQARRRRDLSRRGYEFDVSNLIRQGQKNLLDLNRQYYQGFEPRVSNFSQRGLGRSGLFRQAMSDYATQQQRAIGETTQATTEGLSRLQLQDQQSAQDLQDILDSIQQQKTQDILNSASTIQQWSPFTGIYA